MKRLLMKSTMHLVLTGTILFAATLSPIQARSAAAASATAITEANVVQTVSFRTAPNADSARIRYLQPGEVLDVISIINDYWLNVKDANGKTGYVSASEKYITLRQVSVPKQYNATIVSSVSFRKGPSTDHDRIRYLQPGESVTVIEETNSYWYKVADKNGVTGYVSTNGKYISTTFGQPEDDQQSPADEDTRDEALFPAPPNATVLASVSFRTGPSTDDDRIRYLNSGESLLIIDKPNSYWYKAIDQNGVAGYISTSPTYVDSRYIDAYKQLDPTVTADKVITAGKLYAGTPYEYGSSRYDVTTFDCSDFVRQSFLDGIRLQLPGDSRSQANYVKGIGKTATDWHKLKRGDLLFFMSYRGSSASDYSGIDKSSAKVTHVGIYIGNGEVLHTYSAASGGVRIDSISGKSWEHRFLFGGSAL
ncbi:NlpC/P60 family protein [Paenibacillus hemerocallicola]|uniref:NlpC/P60 family protein n=1 Tax=Paenibacillus hemerocallicola TaxID=1172614 RepID=A0A5C4SX77_9BACL|nr:SH3 domain-containing C40 family peptidase [Paenibacillus hemerocallicola]TNJ59286.1 NlpC/P60 family protein [Paenibacillus hemerocallicola]